MKRNEKLDIVFEDKDLIVVNKPAGLLTVSTEKEKEKTLFHKVLVYEKKKNKNNKIFIVHRLDKDTSGLVVFAKNVKIKSLLQNSWDKLVRLREYVAIVEGIPDEKEKTIKSWLKETKTLITYSSKKEGDGSLAITKYKVIDSINKKSLLKIEIKTGRKNQIRVHMKDIGHPIVGDRKYNAKTNPIRRLCLHANKIILTNPITKKELTFECDIPNSFLSLINK